MPATSLSQVPGTPTFRDAAVNAVAIIPLLSSDKNGDIETSHSSAAFKDLWTALRRHSNSQYSPSAAELLMVVPNSNLTRPGDWKYNDTPLTTFHWQHGCQRLKLFDGRPSKSRLAHDRLYNHALTRDWIDACPSRRTAAVIGVLNMHDCKDVGDLHRAEEELQSWATRYATPPYEVTAHAKQYERDHPVTRLFVFDSFAETCQKINLSKSNMGANILAFPASDEAHKEMMDFHLNLVVNDLTVSIFRALEQKIKESDEIMEAAAAASTSMPSRRTLTQIISRSTAGSGEEPVDTAQNLSLNSISTLLNRQAKSGKEGQEEESESEKSESEDKNSGHKRGKGTLDKRSPPQKTNQQLLTPMDEVFDSALSSKDLEAVRRREVGRRVKHAADLALLAGSPLDAYSRYLKAAQTLKTAAPDPFWYALALEGCAAAHISMAEGGGYDVDPYLENNFSLPDEIIALAQKETRDEVRSQKVKQSFPQVVLALCEEALNITQRHDQTVPFYVSLLLKMAHYSSENAEGHLRCRWGEGDGCYSGATETEPARWQKSSMNKLKFSAELKTIENVDMIYINTQHRIKKFCELLHSAVSAGGLDTDTRVDVAGRAARLCLRGVRASQWKKEDTNRILLPRKAAFFTAFAADALSATGNSVCAEQLWVTASKLYKSSPNERDAFGSYGWAALRCSVLFALSMEKCSPSAMDAADELLALLGELLPIDSKSLKRKPTAPRRSRTTDSEFTEHSEISESTVNTVHVQEADGGVSLAKKMLQEGFTSMTADSSLLAVQAKWADDPPMDPVGFPHRQSKAIIPLPCVWGKVSLARCARIQQMCLDRVAVLHRGLPTPSTAMNVLSPKVAGLPLFVLPEVSLRAEPGLDLEQVKVQSKKTEENQGAMATFFNPYAKKKSREQTTRVAGDEERSLSVKFGNRLSVPLPVQRCDLVFADNADGRIQAAALSFTIPRRASNFAVDFPFTIRAPRSDEVGTHDSFELRGFSLNAMGRSVFLTVHTNSTKILVPENVPKPAFWYPEEVSKSQQEEKKEEVELPKIEAYPCQPRLKILYEESRAPLPEGSQIQVNISPGEVYSMPPFLLGNYTGPNGAGMLEQLQVLGVDFPGKSQQLLYCSSKGMKESSSLMSEHEFGNWALNNEEILYVRAVPRDLDITKVNSPGSTQTGGKLGIQIASALKLSDELLEPISATIRFRYRGRATSDEEVWRIMDLSVVITPVKGPRVSSISFRPGLIKSSGFDHFAKVLRQRSPVVSKKEEDFYPFSADALKASRSHNTLECVGKAPGLYVCRDKVVFVLTVTNPFDCDLEIRKVTGPVGGFGDSALGSVIVKALLSVSFPVTLDRIDRTANVTTDFAEKLRLQWRSQNEAGVTTGTGFIQVGAPLLEDIIDESPAFIPRVCMPPCLLIVSAMNEVVDEKTPELEIAMGVSVEFEVSVELQSWIPESCRQADVALEFCCARADDRKVSRDHVWSGRVRQQVSWSKASSHKVRIVWVSPGEYLVSGCARIGEEVWWAPFAARVRVNK